MLFVLVRLLTHQTPDELVPLKIRPSISLMASPCNLI